MEGFHDDAHDEEIHDDAHNEEIRSIRIIHGNREAVVADEANS
jgi:hypothetical protein